MINAPFDTGPTGTFKTLCQKYPDDTVYKGADGFRSLCGPIFYRGRANGTARLLVIGHGNDFTAAELPEIPSGDFPMGLQSWMRNSDFWASMSATPGTERANISVVVP
jgi:uracil-DNA glycosylase